MFHFPTFPPHTLYIQMRVTPHNRCWVSPFGHPRITVRLSTPRGLSQIPTSFIGSWCQGIHHAPLKTWPQRCSRPLYNSQTTHEHQPPNAPTCASQPVPPTRTTSHSLFPQDPTTCRHPHTLPPVTNPPHHTPTPTQKLRNQENAVVLAGPDQTEAPRGTMIDVPPTSTPPAHPWR